MKTSWLGFKGGINQLALSSPAKDITFPVLGITVVLGEPSGILFETMEDVDACSTVSRDEVADCAMSSSSKIVAVPRVLSWEGSRTVEPSGILFRVTCWEGSIVDLFSSGLRLERPTLLMLRFLVGVDVDIGIGGPSVMFRGGGSR